MELLAQPLLAWHIFNSAIIFRYYYSIHFILWRNNRDYIFEA